ncbi:MAG: SDR family NAD(P)-dependent oxidoreductase, partial [Rhizomicrobium sp.]
MALAEQLAAGGANLVLTARRVDRLQKLAQELSGKHRVEAQVFAADLTRAEAPAAIHAFTQSKRLEIELLINNAGFGVFGYTHEIEESRLTDMIDVNCGAVVRLTRIYLPRMVERRSGDILIVASTAAFQPVPFISAYAATKAFDLIFAEGLAEEVRGLGVRVCALCPGST